MDFLGGTHLNMCARFQLPSAAPPPAIDPAAYMQAMQGMMSNPQFMQMAERLGTQMMQARAPLRRRRRASRRRYTQP